MDGWMGGCVGRWMGGWICGSVDGWVGGWVVLSGIYITSTM